MRAHFILLALAGLAALSHPAAAACRVRGEHVTLSDVVVHADRSTKFEVHLADIPARATIGTGDEVRLDMSGAITFRGTRRNVWFTVARPVTTAGGVVRLAEGAEIVHARADGDSIVASVALSADDLLPGEDKDPDEVIAQVRLPCRAIRLGSTQGEDDDEADDTDDTDDAAAEASAEPASRSDRSFERNLSPALGWWRNRGSSRSIVVRAAPRTDAAGVTVTTLSTSEGFFDFEGVARRGDWLRVRRAMAGSEVVGWIRRAELETFNGPLGSTTMCTGNHWGRFGGRSWAGKPPVIRYQGQARIRVGASISYGDNLKWAKVRRSEGYEVKIFEDFPYAEVTNIPGVGVPEWYAVEVALADVILPEGMP